MILNSMGQCAKHAIGWGVKCNFFLKKKKWREKKRKVGKSPPSFVRRRLHQRVGVRGGGVVTDLGRKNRTHLTKAKCRRLGTGESLRKAKTTMLSNK